MKIYFLPLLLLLSITGRVSAGCDAWSEKYAGRSDLLVGEITIHAANIFQTDTAEEGRWIHRLANRWHYTSRESVIRAQLLFAEGDPYSRRELEESARNLRSDAYLHRAFVHETEVCDGRVNIRVDTTDNWSLNASFSYERAGGSNDYRLELREANLFGLGRDLAYQFSRSVDRDRHILFYQDNLFLNSRNQLSLRLEENTDGGGYRFRLQKPFAGLDSRQAWDVVLSQGKSSMSLYDNGVATTNLALENRYVYAAAGFSAGLNNTAVTRYQIGWLFDQREITDYGVSETTLRRFSYPFIGVNLGQDRYVQKNNITVMGSVEDVAVGHQLSATLGWASEQLGSYTDGLVFTSRYHKGFQPSSKVLAQLGLGLDSLYADGGISHGNLSANTRLHYFLTPRSQLYFEGNYQLVHNPYQEEQLLIGGDTGLRGYPLRVQSGDRRYRFTAEYRMFADWYPWRLFRLGAAVFADTGSAWNSGGSPSEQLSDIGTGLRIVSVRQANNRVLHIDLAFPLDRRDDFSKVQLVVKTRTEF